MPLLSVLAYCADATILATYWHLARTGGGRPFHWANAVGCIPLAAIEITTGAYPVLPLTLAFGVIGAIGLRKDRNAT